MSGVNDIIDAIQSGDSVAIDDAFNKEMAARVSDRLDTMRQDVAQNMFKSPEVEVEDLATDEGETNDLETIEEPTEEQPIEDVVETEVEAEAQDSTEESAPDVEVETVEQED